jgi:hypothetical protein
MKKLIKIISFIGAILMSGVYVVAAIIRNGFLGFDFLVIVLITLAILALVAYIIFINTKSSVPIMLFSIVVLVSVLFNVADWENYFLIIVPLVLFNAFPIQKLYLKIKSS